MADLYSVRSKMDYQKIDLKNNVDVLILIISK